MLDVATIAVSVHRDPQDGRYQQVVQEGDRLTPLAEGLPALELGQLRTRLS